jgi:sugar (glycoside-pentoside-hexuronide) transporter
MSTTEQAPSTRVVDTGRLSPIRKIGYSAGDFANNMSWTLVSTYLLFFLTDVALLPSVLAGVMLFIPRLFDAFVDPFIGSISDRTKTRWGRYRPFILFACVPMLVLNVLTFSTFPTWSEGGRATWAFITYFLLVILYSAINIPYSALAAAITRNAETRSSLASYRMTAAFLAGGLLSLGLLPIVNWIGGGDQALGYQRAAILFSVIALPFYLWAFFANKEVVHVPHVRVSMKSFFSTLKGNTPVWLLVGAFLAWGLMLGALSMKLYYFTYNSGDDLLFGSTTVVQFGMAAVGAYAVTPLVKLVRNKATLAIIGFFGGGVVNIIWFFVPAAGGTGSLIAFYIMAAMIGLSWGLVLASIYGMIPDITEYTIHRYKIHAAGFISAFITFALKVGTAAAGLGTGAVLGAVGYVANTTQSDTTLFWINFSANVFLGLMMLAGGVCLLFYRLDKKTYNQIVNELEALGDRQVEEMA